MPATHDNAGIAAWRFKLRAQIGSYEDCASAMAKLGECGFAPIGPHMTLIHEGHDADPDQEARAYAVELYETKIIRYYPNATFSVDNGGHATPTTSARLDAVLPEGFRAYHHRKQLGLWNTVRGIGHAVRKGPKLWPLDHSQRITLNGVLLHSGERADRLSSYVRQFPMGDPGSEPTVEDCERYLLIEENVHGPTPPYWLTTHSSPADAAEYHDEQEYIEDYEVLELIDLDTGCSLTARTTFEAA